MGIYYLLCQSIGSGIRMKQGIIDKFLKSENAAIDFWATLIICFMISLASYLLIFDYYEDKEGNNIHHLMSSDLELNTHE